MRTFFYFILSLLLGAVHILAQEIPPVVAALPEGSALWSTLWNGNMLAGTFHTSDLSVFNAENWQLFLMENGEKIIDTEWKKIPSQERKALQYTVTRMKHLTRDPKKIILAAVYEEKLKLVASEVIKSYAKKMYVPRTVSAVENAVKEYMQTTTDSALLLDNFAAEEEVTSRFVPPRDRRRLQ